MTTLAQIHSYVSLEKTGFRSASKPNLSPGCGKGGKLGRNFSFHVLPGLPIAQPWREAASVRALKDGPNNTGAQLAGS